MLLLSVTFHLVDSPGKVFSVIQPGESCVCAATHWACRFGMDLQTCLRNTLKNKYQKLSEDDNFLPINVGKRSLGKVDTLPHRQHEFRYIDHSDLHTVEVQPPFPMENLLSCDCKHGSSKKTVLSVGVCGVGKTTAVQHCALNWAEKKWHHDIELLFPLSFWELNIIKRELNLIELLQEFYPELKEPDAGSLTEKKVWMILDGLDEYNKTLDFSCPKVSEVTRVTSVDVLVTNLLRGDLLPRSHIWITTRYAAAKQIPPHYLLKETEVQGFSNEQKELHVRNLVSNEDLAERVIDHIKISRSLHYLCQIPPICTIMATVLAKHVKPGDFKIRPLSLTQIYSKLIEASDSDIISKLKCYALYQAWKLKDLTRSCMYEQDLEEFDINIPEASAYSRQCPLVFREERGLHNVPVFRFAHCSIMEFLAASAQLETNEDSTPEDSTPGFLSDYCQFLVAEALHSTKAKYDVCLRFLFGLLKERGTLKASDPFFAYTRKIMLENMLNYNAVTLFHCLREFDSQALLDEVEFFKKKGRSPIQGIASLQWYYAMQKITNFEGTRETFQLELPSRCDDKLLRCLPVILKSMKAMLRFSNLTDKCCPALAAVLSTRESYLRELDLGYNSISDSGVKKLVEGLNDKDCRLKTLRLHACELTSFACKHLATALKESPKLRELDLSCNKIGDVGMRHLACGLESPECRLEALRLSQCNIKREGCSHLASALKKNPNHLKWLDLSVNTFGDKAANELLKEFDISKLTKLEMYYCGLTAQSCERIGEALKIESSNLVEFNLSNNSLKDGIALVCNGMYAWSRVEKLNLSRCGITKFGCPHISKVLSCISQLHSREWVKSEWQATELRDLDLSFNCLTDDGVKDIAAGLRNPYSNLRKLNLSDCNLTHDCCTELGIELSTYECRVSEVDLSNNFIQDKGVKKLCQGLRKPQCRLKKLSLRNCGLTSKSIDFLNTALKTNSDLEELYLMGNSLDEAGIRLLLRITKNDKYRLHTVDVSD